MEDKLYFKTKKKEGIMATPTPGPKSSFPSYFNFPKVVGMMDKSTKIVLGILTAAFVLPGAIYYTYQYFHQRHHFTAGMPSGTTAPVAASIGPTVLHISKPPVIKGGYFSSYIHKDQPDAVKDLLGMLEHNETIPYSPSEDPNFDVKQEEMFHELVTKDTVSKKFYSDMGQRMLSKQHHNAIDYLWYRARNDNLRNLPEAINTFTNYMQSLPDEVVPKDLKLWALNMISSNVTPTYGSPPSRS